ncbi:MAG: RNA-binding protein [Salinirussus sp.]
MEITARHHLRSDAIEEIRAALHDGLGIELDADTFEEVELADSDRDVVLVDGEPLVFYHEGEPFLTVRGANVYPPDRRIVTVDAGAVQFVSDGADIMRPGIVDADQEITAGDLVVIAEESHGKVLAIGRSRVDGEDLQGEQGKVVDSVHHVGDDLYQLSA